MSQTPSALVGHREKSPLQESPSNLASTIFLLELDDKMPLIYALSVFSLLFKLPFFDQRLIVLAIENC